MTDRGIFVVDRRTWVHDVAFTAISALIYAFLAPFGTNLVPLQERVAQNFALGFASFAVLWPPMRLALRFGERDGLPGERGHRSWWVARGAVGASRMEGRRACLTLINGLKVSASREATTLL